MKQFKLARIFIVAVSVALLISYLGIWIRFINDPVERTGSDFMGFYSIGRIANEAGAAFAYDPLLQQSIQEKLVGFPLAPGQVLLNQHLPFLIPLLQTITDSDYIGSFYRWNLLMILLYATSIILLGRVLKEEKLDDVSILLAGTGAFLFYPLFFSLLNGQDTALLLLGTTIWAFSLLTGKEWIAGLGLSLATVRPHLVILFALPMFFQFRKAFWGFVIGSVALALISYAVVGWRGTVDFINILLISAQGRWYGLNENAMFNLIGLLLRIFPWLEAGIIHLMGWILYGATIIALCILWGRNKDLEDGRMGLTAILALFVAPHLHFHDLTLLLIPIYESIRISQKTESLETSIAITIPIAISLLLLISNISPFLEYTTPYLVMLALALYPYSVKYKVPMTAPRRS